MFVAAGKGATIWGEDLGLIKRVLKEHLGFDAFIASFMIFAKSSKLPLKVLHARGLNTAQTLLVWVIFEWLQCSHLLLLIALDLLSCRGLSGSKNRLTVGANAWLWLQNIAFFCFKSPFDLNKLIQLTFFRCGEDAFEHPVESSICLEGLVKKLWLLFLALDHCLNQRTQSFGHQRSAVVLPSQLCTLEFDEFKFNGFDSITTIALKVNQDGLKVFPCFFVDLGTIFTLFDHVIDLSMT